MAGIINTSSIAKALWPGVNAWYGKAYEEYPVEFDKLFEKHTSKKQYEEDVGLVGLGLARIKAEGAPVTYDSMNQGFITRYQHIVYANGFQITMEMLEDDQYDVVAPKKAKELAFGMRQTKEIIGANVYNNAFNTNYVGGDGVTLLNSAHPNISGGTYSNVLATASDLSEAALEQAAIDISLLRNDRGLIVSLIPQSIHVHPAYEFEIARILKTSGRVGTDNNDINALKEMGMFPKGVHVNHYFSSLDSWFIRTNCQDGMKYFERMADTFDDDSDFETRNLKYVGLMRFSFGWTDPRALYGSPGA